MNATWYPWSGSDPATYRAAWRRLHDRFSQVGLAESSVQWIWSPNSNDVGAHRAETFYPGDDYVDWIGIDGYNFGDQFSWSTWKRPEEEFDPMIRRMRSLASKPLCVPEYGSSSKYDGQYRPEEKAKWISDVFDLIAEENVKLASWFNTDKRTDWAVFGANTGPDSSLRRGIATERTRRANETSTPG